MTLLRGLACVGLMALAGCVAPRAPVPEPVMALRAPGSRISSAVLFDPARFAGRWYVAESAIGGCAGAAQDWVWDGSGYRVNGIDCSGNRPRVLAGRMALTGPGARFTPDPQFGPVFNGEPVWAMWFDQDYRTVALGTPSGRFGMILTRTLPPGADLMRAAREVLDFNGYDIRRIGR